MSNRALVIASFGTSVPEARPSIAAVEDALAAAAPDHAVVRAFTSPTIRRILKSRGEEVPDLTEALERLSAGGVRQVIIQPTHLLYGYEYDKLKAEADALAGRFEDLTVGRPLLADNHDIQRFACRLSQDHPAEAGTATVFMGHGTEHFANAAYPAMQTALAFLGRSDIYIGTVEGWPGLEDILRQLEPGGRRSINLLPLMLVAGDHARNDMAGDWKSRLEQAGHAVTCSFTGLGELPWVREMYRERLEKLL
ncbi:MAG: sirohydrochlorin cobaltochelatase [Oscillospiraceae bacterium]|nr:sirohydrochlorin cobaltochelatase [Oscillospiraceae bacterium]